MDSQPIIEYSRKIRLRCLKQPAQWLISQGITATYLTFLSLILGIMGVIYLFENQVLFILFMLLHLLADSLDGVVAKLTRPLKSGAYFDYFTDYLIAVLLLVQIYSYLQDNYVLIVLGLSVFSQALYLWSKQKSPLIIFRTGLALSLMFYPLFPVKGFLTLAYLVIGVFVVYGLLLQLNYFIRLRWSS